jgi:hypothetical protein
MLLSSVSESAVAVCVLHESRDHTGQVKEVSLSAQLADSGLSVVTTVVAAAAHPRAAPPASVHSLLFECPAETDLECLELQVHAPTPSPNGSSSSLAQLPPYPSSCRLPSVKEMVEDYRMARYK